MDYLKRVEKLRQELNERSFEALIIDKPIDLMYLSGMELSLGRLFLSPTECILFVDGRYFEDCQENCPFQVLNSQDNAFLEHIKKSQLKSLAFDSAYTSHQNYLHLKKNLQCELLAWACPLKVSRLKKDTQEIDILRKAADLGSRGYDLGVSLLKIGVSEIEIAQKIEIFWKEHGAIAPSFDINVSFGKNSSKPHHRASEQLLKKGDIVLFDIGVNYQHYASDMTRTLFFGEKDPKLAEIYQIVLQAQEKALSLCKKGSRLGDLDKISREHIEKSGYSEYYPHGLGHGIGLEIHESPGIRDQQADSDMILQEGMVFTIEPGIYLPGWGGVRIEDSICIKGDSYENFSQRSKELMVIDAE